MYTIEHMIKELVYFIRRLFRNEDIENYGDMPTYYDVSNSPVRKVKREKKSVFNKKNKNISSTAIISPSLNSQDKNNVRSNVVVKKITPEKLANHEIIHQSGGINKAVLMRKIKTNIFFLEQLLGLLEGNNNYRNYYRKVREMKEQSENCFKLVHRMKEEAPYFQNTLKTIVSHTNTIAKLLDIK